MGAALGVLLALACLVSGARAQAKQRECGWYSAVAAFTCRRLRLRAAVRPLCDPLPLLGCVSGCWCGL